MNSATRRWAPLLLVVLIAGGSELYAERAALSTVSVSSNHIDWIPLTPYGCLQLTVTGPSLTSQQSFAADRAPSFDLPADGLKDGSYSWELSRADRPCGTQLVRPAPADDAVEPEAEEPDANGRPAAHRGRPDRAPVGEYTQSGRFLVRGGAIVVPGGEREPNGGRR